MTGWARNGLTYDQIAHNCGINTATLYTWKNRFSEINNALKKGREVCDLEVEGALYKRAMGYTTSVKKTFKVRRVVFDPATGRKIKEYEELVQGEDELHVPADTTAQIYWLNNRKPESWRAKPDAVKKQDTSLMQALVDLVQEDDAG